MGSLINNRALTANKLLGLPLPILLCLKRIDFNTAIASAGFQTVSLNLPLAKALSEKTDKVIAMSVTSAIMGLLPKSEAIYLTDYEMLFDPRYCLDVIRLFCEISRYNRLIVQWCGTVIDDALTYAEPGYDDYRKYRISDYEIACVI